MVNTRKVKRKQKNTLNNKEIRFFKGCRSNMLSEKKILILIDRWNYIFKEKILEADMKHKLDIYRRKYIS